MQYIILLLQTSGVGMGFAVVVSRIGTMLAPYILLMGQFSPVIFGLSALLSGLCALMLPETLGQQSMTIFHCFLINCIDGVYRYVVNSSHCITLF